VPISGLVLVFESAEALNDQALERLRSQPCISVGPRENEKVAIVVDSISKEHDIEIWNEIRDIPGVVDIRIAFVGFDDLIEDSEPELTRCEDLTVRFRPRSGFESTRRA
jgi:nitrate reductase NapAB chaperone NapD